MILTPKNWTTFQHYRDRRPPWIKLHKSLLDDVDYLCLPDASKALAPFLWLLASEYQEGQITLTIPKMALRLRMSEEKLMDGLKPLIDEGFFVASDTLAEVEQSARLDREEKEKEKEKEPPPQPAASAGKAKPKKAEWKKGFDNDILDATTEIIGFWPNESRRQPNSDSRVPRSSGPQLAARLSRIKQSGGDLSVCVAIAKRAVDEFEHGKWAKAAENFFGKSEDAPWIAYYQAHTTNMETADAP